MNVNDLYYKRCHQFKENEKPEVLLTIVDNPNAIKLIIAWSGIDTSPVEELNGVTGKSESEIWSWLWDNTEYSIQALKDKLDISISEQGLRSRLKPLINNRVIYPDGTINSFVEKYLREQVVRLFQNGRRKQDT